jgi:two-component system NarL family response regulator
MALVASVAANTPASATSRACRLVLIDGQRIFRQALWALLEATNEFAVVGEAAQWSDGLELIASLQPDVVITDLHLADGSAVQLIEEIRTRFPKTSVLVLTDVRARDAAIAVRKAGALGYLLKDCGHSELRDALRTVAAGRSYRARSAARTAGVQAHAVGLSNRVAYLTDRQRLILRSVARGHGARQIAEMLGVSVRAVHKQRERLRNTLRLNSTAALTRFALREGLTE